MQCTEFKNPIKLGVVLKVILDQNWSENFLRVISQTEGQLKFICDRGILLGGYKIYWNIEISGDQISFEVNKGQSLVNTIIAKINWMNFRHGVHYNHLISEYKKSIGASLEGLTALITYIQYNSNYPNLFYLNPWFCKLVIHSLVESLEAWCYWFEVLHSTHIMYKSKIKLKIKFSC